MNPKLDLLICLSKSNAAIWSFYKFLCSVYCSTNHCFLCLCYLSFISIVHIHYLFDLHAATDSSECDILVQQYKIPISISTDVASQNVISTLVEQCCQIYPSKELKNPYEWGCSQLIRLNHNTWNQHPWLICLQTSQLRWMQVSLLKIIRAIFELYP